MDKIIRKGEADEGQKRKRECDEKENVENEEMHMKEQRLQ